VVVEFGWEQLQCRLCLLLLQPEQVPEVTVSRA